MKVICEGPIVVFTLSEEYFTYTRWPALSWDKIRQSQRESHDRLHAAGITDHVLSELNKHLVHSYRGK